MTGGTVDLRHSLNTSKRETKGTEIVGEGFGCFCDPVNVVGLAGFNRDESLEVIVFAQEVTLHLDRGHHIRIALGDVDRDGHVFFVGRQSDLRRVDIELDVAAGQVIGPQVLQISSQLCAGIAV